MRAEADYMELLDTTTTSIGHMDHFDQISQEAFHQVIGSQKHLIQGIHKEILEQAGPDEGDKAHRFLEPMFRRADLEPAQGWQLLELLLLPQLRQLCEE